MTRIVQAKLVAAALALVAAGPGAAYAQPAVGEAAKSDAMARCAVEKHPNEARWLKAILSKEVSLEPEVGGGAILNALGPVLQDCLMAQERPNFDVDGFFTTLLRIAGSAGPARAGPMDALGSCFVKVAPQEAMAFVRESDIGASRSFTGTQVNMGYVSDSALNALLSAGLSKSPECGPILKKMGERVDANQLYSRINWLLRAGPKSGAVK